MARVMQSVFRMDAALAISAAIISLYGKILSAAASIIGSIISSLNSYPSQLFFLLYKNCKDKLVVIFHHQMKFDLLMH